MSGWSTSARELFLIGRPHATGLFFFTRGDLLSAAGAPCRALAPALAMAAVAFMVEVVPMRVAEEGAADLLEAFLSATRTATQRAAKPTTTLRLRPDKKSELNDPAHLGSVRWTQVKRIGRL